MVVVVMLSPAWLFLFPGVVCVDLVIGRWCRCCGEGVEPRRSGSWYPISEENFV